MMLKYMVHNTKDIKNKRGQCHNNGIVLFPASRDACLMACLHDQLLTNSQHLLFLELDPQVLHSAEKDCAFA